MSCMNNDMLQHASRFDTSRKTWFILETNFSSRSCAKSIQLKKELQNFKKCGLSIGDYVLKIKTLFDELAFIGYAISDNVKLMFILSHLDENFDNVFSTIIEKMLTKKFIIGNAKALLLNHENRLERRKTSVNLTLKNSRSFSTSQILY